MSIMISSSEGGEDKVQRQFKKLLPHLACYIYPQIKNVDDIEYAVIWKHPHSDLYKYRNLKAILSLAAGVDHILADPKLPDVPIVRLADIEMADDMAMHCLFWTLNFQRKYYYYHRAQQQQQWRSIKVPRKSEFTTAVLGLGEIGSGIAATLATNGFNSIGWSNSAKQIANVTAYAGREQLVECVSQADVLICCLPATSDTRGIIDFDLLKQLRQGSYFINVSRGELVNDNDLTKLIVDGHLQAAALDVFNTEPLPAESPYWHHPNIFVTPHISGPTGLSSAAALIAENIKRIENGKAPFPLVDRVKNY